MIAIVLIINQNTRFISATPLSGGFGLNRPCRIGNKHERIIEYELINFKQIFEPSTAEGIFLGGESSET